MWKLSFTTNIEGEAGWETMGEDPWEPKGIPWETTHGRENPWEPKGSMGGGVWEGTLGPTILIVFCDEFTYIYFQKNSENSENRIFGCSVRPDPVKLRVKRFVWSVRSSRTP